ncbi:hypothetical protein FALCPG4_005230 [Fusarium falciforme]
MSAVTVRECKHRFGHVCGWLQDGCMDSARLYATCPELYLLSASQIRRLGQQQSQGLKALLARLLLPRRHLEEDCPEPAHARMLLLHWFSLPSTWCKVKLNRTGTGWEMSSSLPWPRLPRRPGQVQIATSSRAVSSAQMADARCTPRAPPNAA